MSANSQVLKIYFRSLQLHRCLETERGGVGGLTHQSVSQHPISPYMYTLRSSFQQRRIQYLLLFLVIDENEGEYNTKFRDATLDRFPALKSVKFIIDSSSFLNKFAIPNNNNSKQKDSSTVTENQEKQNNPPHFHSLNLHMAYILA